MQEKYIEAQREKMLGKYEEAASILNGIFEEDRQNHATAYELARVNSAIPNQQEALRWAKKAIELDPTNEWYQVFLAELYQKSGNNLLAAEVYQRLVERQPTRDSLYIKWAYLLVRANRIEEAIEVYDRLEKQAGVNEETVRRKHALYLGLGKNKEASRELEKLIDAFPSEARYFHLLAEFYRQIGDNKEAAKIYRQILDKFPDNAKARLELAGLDSGQLKSSPRREALARLVPVFERPDVDIDLKVKEIIPLINQVANTGDAELGQSLLNLTTILERVHPQEAKAYAASADLLYYTGQPDKALEKYLKTLELDQSVFLVWEQVLYIYREKEDYESLAQTAENALDLFPNKALVQYMLGLAYNEQGQYSEALNALELGVLMTGGDSQMQFRIAHQLGVSYDGLEEYDRADTYFQEAMNLHDRDPALLADYSYSLAKRSEKLERAREMAELANTLMPGKTEYQDTYGWVLFQMEAYEKAEQWISKALETGGNEDPRILEHYGDVLFKLGEQERAVNYWTQAREKGNTSSVLQKKITDKQLYE